MYVRSASAGGSRGGNGSISSNGKRNGTNYRYRTVNAQSEVDETLFGTPHRVTTAAKLRAERQLNQRMLTKSSNSFIFVHLDQERAQSSTSRPAKKEFVRHITKDLIRDIM